MLCCSALLRICTRYAALLLRLVALQHLLLLGCSALLDLEFSWIDTSLCAGGTVPSNRAFNSSLQIEMHVRDVNLNFHESGCV